MLPMYQILDIKGNNNILPTYENHVSHTVNRYYKQAGIYIVKYLCGREDDIFTVNSAEELVKHIIVSNEKITPSSEVSSTILKIEFIKENMSQ